MANSPQIYLYELLYRGSPDGFQGAHAIDCVRVIHDGKAVDNPLPARAVTEEEFRDLLGGQSALLIAAADAAKAEAATAQEEAAQRVAEAERLSAEAINQGEQALAERETALTAEVDEKVRAAQDQAQAAIDEAERAAEAAANERDTAVAAADKARAAAERRAAQLEQALAAAQAENERLKDTQTGLDARLTKLETAAAAPAAG